MVQVKVRGLVIHLLIMRETFGKPHLGKLQQKTFQEVM
jgi:hypothetical protein